MHSLDSDYVRDQLTLRLVPLNTMRRQPEGDFVLYWMQSTQRFEENWALRHAVREADRLGKPLLIHQGLDPTYEHASDRFHTFILENARELAARAPTLGLTYRFALRRRRDDDRRVVDRLAARAVLVVTDRYPTAGVAARSTRLAERAPCLVEAVESHAIVPSGLMVKEEYAARTIRPKLYKVLDTMLEPVEDRPPRRALDVGLLDNLDVEWLDLARANIASEVAACEIDHSVPPVSAQYTTSGLTAARARLAAFVATGLDGYAERRGEPGDPDGSSRLSPWLHFGQISPAEVLRAVKAAGGSESFDNEMVTWRELSLNFCLFNPQFASLKALPDWVHRTMTKHVDDPRDVLYSLAELEAGRTHDTLWNAAQRELVVSGAIHNVMRMLWGKSVLLWTARYTEAFNVLVHLNNKYALDGRDPSSYAGIQWCFGKFDRAFQERPVWGQIRPMSLQRAHAKYDTKAYLARWGEGGTQTTLF
jgi:deoxyribodipyrimidine photo-lyase